MNSDPHHCKLFKAYSPKWIQVTFLSALLATTYNRHRSLCQISIRISMTTDFNSFKIKELWLPKYLFIRPILAIGSKTFPRDHLSQSHVFNRICNFWLIFQYLVNLSRWRILKTFTIEFSKKPRCDCAIDWWQIFWKSTVMPNSIGVQEIVEAIWWVTSKGYIDKGLHTTPPNSIWEVSMMMYCLNYHHGFSDDISSIRFGKFQKLFHSLF